MVNFPSPPETALTMLSDTGSLDSEELPTRHRRRRRHVPVSSRRGDRGPGHRLRHGHRRRVFAGDDVGLDLISTRPPDKSCSASASARTTFWRSPSCGRPGGCGRVWSRRAAGRRRPAPCGSTPGSSKRVLTLRDPYVNLLRNTVACFAAGLGGAEAITSVPFDSVLGLPDDFSRRIARNTVLVLQEEAHLHRVIDPAGGSWFLDRSPNKSPKRPGPSSRRSSAKAACSRRSRAAGSPSRSTRRSPRGEEPRPPQGGHHRRQRVPQCPRSNRSSHAPLTDSLAGCGGPANFDTHAKPVAALDQTRAQKIVLLRRSRRRSRRIDRPARRRPGLPRRADRIPPLAPHPFAEPFEELRDASDAWQAAHGQRPRCSWPTWGRSPTTPPGRPTPRTSSRPAASR